jgi:hypothetical protein
MGQMINACRNLITKLEARRPLHVDGRIILKWHVNQIGLAQDRGQFSDSINGGDFLDYLKDS